MDNMDNTALAKMYEDRRKNTLLDNFNQMINLIELMYIIDSDDQYMNEIMFDYEEKCKSFIEYYNTGNACYLIDRDVNGLFEYVDYLMRELYSYRDINIDKDVKKILLYNEYVNKKGVFDESLGYYLSIIFNKSEEELKSLSKLLDLKK